MPIKKLSLLISKALLVGCVGFTMTGSAYAYSNNYWQGFTSNHLSQYKFRPLNNDRQQRFGVQNQLLRSQPGKYATPYRYNRGQQRTQRIVKPVYSRFNMPTMNPAYPSFAMPMRQMMLPAAYMASNTGFYQPTRYRYNSKPAFTRQYGWAPAQKMTVRKGGVSNHYASDVNAAFSEVTVSKSAPEFRSEPVTSQGFRYRAINRNPGHVSFADRMRQLIPAKQNQAVPVDVRVAPQVAQENIQTKRWQEPAMAPLKKLPKLPRTVESRPLISQTTSPVVRNQHLVQIDASKYRFRPDERFVFSESSSVQGASSVDVSAVNDYQLANTQMESEINDYSNKWFFRPAEPTPF